MAIPLASPTSLSLPARKSPPSVRSAQMERIESCHSTWFLDPEEKRFARLPKGGKGDPSAHTDAWEPYFAHEVQDDRAHVLALNEAKTRLLRFFEHVEPCPHCARDKTEELRVEPAENGAD